MYFIKIQMDKYLSKQPLCNIDVTFRGYILIINQIKDESFL